MAHNIYNLIILDRSGSMTSIRNEAVNGVNETLGTIRSFGRRNPLSRQFVTLLAFCSCEMQYIYNCAEASTTRNIRPDDFRPCCCTPLYDAIGLSCKEISRALKSDPDAKVSVTIITDGYENDSKEWNGPTIKKLIESLKAEGWLFAYIGADHDVEKAAMTISIENTLTFDKTPQGTARMFEQERACRESWMAEASCDCAPGCCNENYFNRGNRQ